MTKRPTRGLRRRMSSQPPEPLETPIAGSTTIQRRPRIGRGLPNGRAVVGGLLVTAAAVMVFGAYTGAASGPDQRAVAVRSAVPVGHRLTHDDLVVEPVTLPSGTAGATFTSVDEVVGAVTLAPLDDDELVQRSAVHDDGADLPAGHEFSFPIDRERAVDGSLEAGETVDLLATYGSGADSYTVVLARGARVVGAQVNGRGTIGGTGSLVMTVALTSADDVLDVAHAAQVAELTVVRATRADESPSGRDRTASPAPGAPSSNSDSGARS